MGEGAEYFGIQFHSHEEDLLYLVLSLSISIMDLVVSRTPVLGRP